MAKRRNRSSRRTRGRPYPLLAVASLAVVVIAVLVGWGMMNAGAGDPNSGNQLGNGGGVATTPAPTDPAQPEPTQAQTPVPSEPAATAAPTPEPTPTVAPTPTALVGEFGSLPPGQLPSGGGTRQRVNLEYRLDLSLQSIPKEAPVYHLQPRAWTAEDVGSLAQSLGITGEVSQQGEGSFRVSGDGDLLVTEELVQYVAPRSGTPTSGQLPPDEQLIEAAKTWLLEHGLVGADIGQGSVAVRDEDAGRAKVIVKPIEPGSILSATPSATVVLDPDLNVLQSMIVQWPRAMTRSDYGLRAPGALWEEVQQGNGYLEIDEELLPDGADPLEGHATFTATSLAYTLARNPDSSSYLVPLVVFEGTAEISNAPGPVPVKIYLQAVSAQAAPRG